MSDFKNQSPWGTPPGGGGSGNGGFRKGPTPPNIDEVISKLQSVINRFLGGGKGGAKPIIIGLEPPDLPPENLFMVFCKFLIISSRFGGSCLEPDPFPPGVRPPPPGGGEPHGD